MVAEKRRYRRASRYSAPPLTVGLEPELRRDLEREAEREDVALADLARQCIRAGLARIKDTNRKRRGKSSGIEAVQ